jgi:xanthine dehydrogenase accessory factor
MKLEIYSNESSNEATMREVFTEVGAWRKDGKAVAIATNVMRDGASLRPLGAKMAMTTQQDIAGSVTGGCIEGVVYEEAQGVLKTGEPKLLHYGVVSEQNPWDAGLSCGNSLDVFVETLDSPAWQEIYPALKTCLELGQMAAVATVISGPGLGNKLMLWPDGRRLGDLGDVGLNTQAVAWMLKQMAAQETTWASFDVADEKAVVFVDVFTPVSRLVVIGAVHIAMPLVELAKTLGFKTIVIDPRTAFATRERFPQVDELITEWPSTALENWRPDEGTYIAAISHDEKLDNPALAIALKSPARYVGVLGTRKNIGKRLAALREMGLTEKQLGRLRAPIGTNIGAILPDEIALSVLAEIVAAKHGMQRVGELMAAVQQDD